MLSTSLPVFAQITSPNGSSSQESRTSSMGSQPATPASQPLESNVPQSSDAKSGQRASSATSGHKTEGAGGFDNGLYGTGSGNNK
ncbi:beta-xylosidase [Paraburkholderia sp. LEh10]|nr:beta-xylosidase [Paraburkholderia sp. LEh10]